MHGWVCDRYSYWITDVPTTGGISELEGAVGSVEYSFKFILRIYFVLLLKAGTSTVRAEKVLNRSCVHHRCLKDQGVKRA